MPIVCLIRHAENDYVKKGRLAGRLPGVHLNEHGRQQARTLAERLANARLQAVYTSPLERAIETAEPLAARLGLEAQLRPGLLEVEIGEWSGKTLKSLRRLKEWRTVQQHPSLFQFPGGESFADCQLRVVNEIKALCGMHQEKDMIACITHADPIKLAAAFFTGLPLDNFQRLGAAPASITVLNISNAGSLLLSLNNDLSFHFSKA